MNTKQTFVNLQDIVDHSKPNFQDSKIKLSKLAIQSRQKRVHQLKLRGFNDKEISEKTGFSLSTIEKDLHDIREKTRAWYENESVKDYCSSLNDSIILCDNAIKDLQVLYQECDNITEKITILKQISDFEERKMKLFEKTNAVKKFRGN